MATASYPDISQWPSMMSRRGLLTRSRPAVRPLAPYRIARTATLLLGFMLLNKLGAAGTMAFFVILSLMVLRSPRAAFQAIALCGLALMINTAFVPKSTIWTLGRLVIPALAMVRFLIDLITMRVSGRGLVTYGALLVYILAMAVCSIMSGWYTQIALLKLLNFWICMTAIWIGTMVLRERRIDISEWFVSLIVATAVIGLLALVVGESANFVRGDRLIDSMFVGAFVHPNIHGLFASLFFTFLSSVALFAPYRHRWILAPWIGVWLLFMAWSASRTAFVASALGLGVLAIYSRPFRSRSGRRLTNSVSRTVIITSAVISGIALVAIDLSTGGTISRRLVQFVNKNEQLDEITAATVLSSRQALINMSWSNFLENPVFGIGFQVAKTQEFIESATLFTAPAEKGFLPTAVLEEGGAIGTITFIIFLTILVTSMGRERNVSALAAIAALLGGNLTEVSLFSPGGAGLLGWTMVGAASILGDHCWVPDTRSSGAVPSRRIWQEAIPARSPKYGGSDGTSVSNGVPQGGQGV